jgi:hypothetical protein
MSKRKPIAIGNKKTRVVHGLSRGDACRASEIHDSHRVRFQTEQDLIDSGYRKCKVRGCWPVEEEEIEQ